jgi:cytochrome c-type biogenesis protein CcmH/NrfG
MIGTVQFFVLATFYLPVAIVAAEPVTEPSLTATSQGGVELLIAKCSEAITKNPRDTMAYVYRAAAYVRLGIYSSALPDYDSAIALRPEPIIASYI